MEYFYNGQIKRYISQFLRIFSGLKVQTGVDRDGDNINDFIDVPVHYGSMDRIVANVLHKEGTFVPQKVPIITGYLTSLEINQELKKAPTHQDHIRKRDIGDSKDSIATRTMGVPYRATMQLNIMTSNTEQSFQILEQILLMFNPNLAFQKSDNLLDWSYITYAELLTIDSEENYPAGVDERLIIWSLTFSFDFWLNFPYLDQQSIIEEVQVKIKDTTAEITDLETLQVTSSPQFKGSTLVQSQTNDVELNI